MKEFDKKKSKDEADRAHGSSGQLSRPSVWERIQEVEPLRITNSFEPLVKFVNQQKLALSVSTVESQKKDNKRGDEERSNGTRCESQKRNER